MTRTARLLAAAALLALASCGGDDSSSGGGATPAPVPSPSPTATPGSVSPFVAPAAEALTPGEVQQIIAQAVGEAQAQNLPSVIAVVDRVGNVLGVFRMNGAPGTMETSRLTGTGILNDPAIDAQGLEVDAALGAISKALTGAYLSSSGNAFGSRTASQIVQQHFPPAPTTVGLEAGPLFGVQFSQLPCSDLNTRFSSTLSPGSFIGPKRAPLGLAADPGGLPLYKNGVVVGGIGVMGDRDYGFDPNVLDVDKDAEEIIALAGTQGFARPDEIAAERITLDGTQLRLTDAAAGDLHPLQTSFGAINGPAGQLVPVTGYSNGTIIAGTPYGTEASGYRQAKPSDFAFSDAFVLSDGAGNNRFPIRDGADAAAISEPLAEEEVRAILEEGFKIMRRSRGQIRRPLDSQAQVTISVVDTYGTVLGLVRSPDAPIFGTDVSLQKARTVMFFSSPDAAQQMLDDPADEIADFVQRTREFLGDPTALTGKTAFGARGIGNLARPHFPDGEAGRGPGPFSRPIEDFNPFGVGLQIALVKANLLQHAVFVGGQAASDTGQQCTSLPPAPSGQIRLANGMQIFSGGVPIYRGGVLIGGIGVSGDGIDQDDMISFLGVHYAAQRMGTFSNAPSEIRSDKVIVDAGSQGTRLRFVNCPFAPFLDSSEQNVCQGL